eukprot:jgi/Tetstr1/439822/TSEL_028233.t1
MRVRLVSPAAQAAVAANPAMTLLAPMVYIVHRRDLVVVRDRVRLSDARRRTRSANGLVELARLLLGAGLSHGAGGDFVFDEFYQEEVLGRVDHGHGLEESKAIDASVREDQVRLDVIEDFLNGNGSRPFNAKIDNILLGVSYISGLLGAHNRPLAQLDVPGLEQKLADARAVLGRKRGARCPRYWIIRCVTVQAVPPSEAL